MPELTIWKFTPVAHRDDPRWLGRTDLKTVFVAAETLGEALLAVQQWSAADEAGGVGNESGHDHSVYADEKLYRADRASAEEAAPFADQATRRGVLSALPAEAGA